MRNIISKVLFLSSVFIFAYSVCEAQNGVWTWIHGSDTSYSLGNYGVKGMSADSNMPSGRYEPAFWTDLNGNFWLFGGLESGNGNGKYVNDLWVYNTSSKQWTWMGGPQSQTDLNGEFGIKGIPSVNNYPSARGYGSNCWTDSNGHLWLYGGNGFAYSGFVPGPLSDLWRYDINTNEWTWMQGSDSIMVIPKYGSMGIPAIGNTPGGRQECKGGWSNGNFLWLFGGQTVSSPQFIVPVQNDLWRYEIATNLWTWIKGDTIPNSLGNYGIKGVEAASNNPPARYSYGRWKGSDNNFFFFGGGTFYELFNDVWKYNLSTNNWTWVSGSDISDGLGQYDLYCNPNILDYPCARIENSMIEISADNKNYLCNFGGGSKNGILNDLWIYNMVDTSWTWVSGSDNTVQNPQGNYGTLNVPSVNNVIPNREGAASWRDNENNLYFFGGISRDAVLNAYAHKNDLWKFEPDTSCFYKPSINTSINNFEGENNITAYPNPSNGKFTIETKGILKSGLEIYNVIGEKIFHTKLTSQKSEFMLKLANGIYFYQIKRENQIISTGKLLVQN